MVGSPKNQPRPLSLRAPPLLVWGCRSNKDTERESDMDDREEAESDFKGTLAIDKAIALLKNKHSVS